MLSVEQRFLGAYKGALLEAIMQEDSKFVLDAKIESLYDWLNLMNWGNVETCRETASLIELPILFSFRFQRNPAARIRFTRHQFRDCSTEVQRDAHDLALLRSAYLAELLYGKGEEEAVSFVLRQYDTDFLFTRSIKELEERAPLLDLSGLKTPRTCKLYIETKMFSGACYGAVHGPDYLHLARWQEGRIEHNPLVKEVGLRLFREAYGYT